MVSAPEATVILQKKPDLEQIVLAQVERWIDECHAFRQWYRQVFLLGTPSAEDEKAADEMQPWMIRITRALLTQVSDPEFPYKHLAPPVEALLWQFEEDWTGRHEGMSEQQAKELAEMYFPSES
jgi:hypothetical protein